MINIGLSKAPKNVPIGMRMRVTMNFIIFIIAANNGEALKDFTITLISIPAAPIPIPIGIAFLPRKPPNFDNFSNNGLNLPWVSFASSPVVFVLSLALLTSPIWVSTSLSALVTSASSPVRNASANLSNASSNDSSAAVNCCNAISCSW